MAYIKMLSYFVCPGGVVWITHGTADPIPRVQIRPGHCYFP